MIELNLEQRQAIAQGEPVRIVDPVTHDAYVVVQADVYARLAETASQSAEASPPRIAPMMLRSQQAFWRDLPSLLLTRRNHGKWAAYHGDECVAMMPSNIDAYQECFRRWLKRGEFYVGKIEASLDGIPPWGTIECEHGLVEVTDDNPRDAA